MPARYQHLRAKSREHQRVKYGQCNSFSQDKRHKITWHIEYVKSSHEDTKVKHEFFDWFKNNAFRP